MRRIKPDVDIIKDVLEAVVLAQPNSTFTQSLLQQYKERGSLSKKQLQGLLGKAAKIKSIPTGKIATLEAIILKKPNRNKSELPPSSPIFEKDEQVGKKIEVILEKFPQHKRVLFFKARFDNNETLSTLEISELDRFSKLLK